MDLTFRAAVDADAPRRAAFAERTKSFVLGSDDQTDEVMERAI